MLPLFNLWLSLLIGGASLQSAYAQDAFIRPHKAVYDVALSQAKSGEQLVDVQGKMYFEWNKTCDSWITVQKSILSYSYADGTNSKIKSNFTASESLDGKTLNFYARRESNGVVLDEFRGQASLAGGVVYKVPKNLSFNLPHNTFFPMQHTNQILSRAKRGDAFFNAVLFDGSDDKMPQTVNVFIGSKTSQQKNKVIVRCARPSHTSCVFFTRCR
jgi:hypothetical protein